MPLYLYFFFLLFDAQIQVMEFKFLPMIAIMVAMFPVPNEALLRWVRLNESPVCFGAKWDDFGHFSYHENIIVRSFKLVHRSGKVSCLKTNADSYSNWECYNPNIAAILTDQKNNILAPDPSTVQSTGWSICQDTALPPKCFCSKNRASLMLSLRTTSCVCGMEKICEDTPKAITTARLAQMCMVCWTWSVTIDQHVTLRWIPRK